MAYNRRNKLAQAKKVQDICNKYRSEYGSSAEWVFENKIRNVYFISRTTFFKFLKINVELELKKLDTE